jgi:hypothetical protein
MELLFHAKTLPSPRPELVSLVFAARQADAN